VKQDPAVHPTSLRHHATTNIPTASVEFAIMTPSKARDDNCHDDNLTCAAPDHLANRPNTQAVHRL
jgi:hypothetical protein